MTVALRLSENATPPAWSEQPLGLPAWTAHLPPRHVHVVPSLSLGGAERIVAREPEQVTEVIPNFYEPPSSVLTNTSPNPVPESEPLLRPRISLIEIVLSADRTIPGTLRCIGWNGQSVGGPWSAMGGADTRNAAFMSNPQNESLQPGGSVPTGEYHVVDVLPARMDPVGISIFGPHPVIRLRPVSGDATLADSNGRAFMLIHGGDDNAPMEGSIRVSNNVMVTILKLFPANLEKSHPPIVARVTETARATETVPGTNSVDSKRYSSSVWYDTWTSGDDGMLWTYYSQMYMWQMIMYSSHDPRCQPGDPYPYVECQPSNTPITDDTGSALRALGYDVVEPSAEIPASIVGAAFITAIPTSMVTEVSASTTNWNPESGNAYGR